MKTTRLDLGNDGTLPPELAADFEMSASHFGPVSAFLESRPHLRLVLREAPGQIRRHFPSAKLHLELAVDPEVDDWATLFIVIETTKELEEALAAKDLLYSSWWLDCMPTAHGDLGLELSIR